MILRGLSLGLLALMPAMTWATEPLTFSYVEAKYLAGEMRQRGQGLDSEGFDGTISAALGRRAHLVLDYNHRLVDTGTDFEPEHSYGSAGVGFHNSLLASPDLTSLVVFSYERADVDHRTETPVFGAPPVITDERDTAEGFGVSIGIRGRPGGRMELHGIYKYLNYGDDAEFAQSAGEKYVAHLWRLGIVVPFPGGMEPVALTAGYRLFDDDVIRIQEATVGLRVSIF